MSVAGGQEEEHRGFLREIVGIVGGGSWRLWKGYVQVM